MILNDVLFDFCAVINLGNHMYIVVIGYLCVAWYMCGVVGLPSLMDHDWFAVSGSFERAY